MLVVHVADCLSVYVCVCLCVHSSSDVISPMTDSLSTVFVEFIDGVRLVTEMEADKESPRLNDIRLHFSRFIHHLVSNTPGMYVVQVRTSYRYVRRTGTYVIQSTG